MMWPEQAVLPPAGVVSLCDVSVDSRPASSAFDFFHVHRSFLRKQKMQIYKTNRSLDCGSFYVSAKKICYVQYSVQFCFSASKRSCQDTGKDFSKFCRMRRKVIPNGWAAIRLCAPREIAVVASNAFVLQTHLMGISPHAPRTALRAGCGSASPIKS